MELYIAGGCSEHGRNSFLVTGKTAGFLVDAGKMKEKPGEPWPVLSEDQIAGIRYLFLTHCHADHAGALGWLYEHGFCGTVIASRMTFGFLPEKVRVAAALEDYSEPLREFRLDEDFYVTWGKSGHCLGSVWFLFRTEGKKILFTGDYQENSCAYQCDEIRDVCADIAVVDCAYGFDAGDASENRMRLERRLDELKAAKEPALFPVPAHGRGFDVLRLLAERNMTAVLPRKLASESDLPEDERIWFKQEFLESVNHHKFPSEESFEKEIRSMREGDELPSSYEAAGILVGDSQLIDENDRRMAELIYAAGGKIILTGKQDPSSYARALLLSGKAEFLRLSVHQNAEEMERLAGRNSFQKVVPYHCREELVFKENKYLVLKPGDRVRF